MNSSRPDPVELAAHAFELAAAASASKAVPMGRLYGLAELPDNDYWVDMAGAAVLTGVRPKTITSWLTRGGPVRNPFPLPPTAIPVVLAWERDCRHGRQENRSEPKGERQGSDPELRRLHGIQSR